jgi:hypothetical protein
MRANASVAAFMKCSVASAKHFSITSGGDPEPKGSGVDVIYALRPWTFPSASYTGQQLTKL